MKSVLIFFVLFFSVHVKAQFVGIKVYEKRFVVKQVGDKFTYQTQDFDKSVVIKDCSKKVFKNFWKEFNRKFKHKKITQTETNDYVRLNYKKQILKIDPDSDFGVYLKSMDSAMQSLFMEEKVKCGNGKEAE